MKIKGFYIWFEGCELAMTTRHDLFTFIVGPRTLSLSVCGRGFLLHPGQSSWL
jgi:hypothetical protein